MGLHEAENLVKFESPRMDGLLSLAAKTKVVEAGKVVEVGKDLNSSDKFSSAGAVVV